MGKPYGRLLSDLVPLSGAEQRLVDACRTGTPLHLGKLRPKRYDVSYAVRAEVVRFLALGGDDQAPVHENGIDLRGAWITGVLQLESTTISTSLAFRHCHFVRAPVLRSATQTGSLELSGSYSPGIRGDGFSCTGDLFLRDGFSSDDEVRLVGATIGGDVDCSGARMSSKTEACLRLDVSTIHGGLFFGTGFHGESCVSLNSMHLLRSLDIDGGMFHGLLRGARRDDALSLKQAQIDGALRIANTTLFDVCLEGAQIKYLRDQARCWGTGIKLDGFVYETIGRDAPTSFSERLDWLKRQPPEMIGGNGKPEHFSPQPWQQLIKTLRGMGHSAEALELCVAYQHQLLSSGKVGQSARLTGIRAAVYRTISQFFHRLFNVLAGYGYRPGRLLLWMLGVWLVLGSVYWWAALQGAFAPSNPLVFEHEHYRQCLSVHEPGKKNWYLCESLKSEYSTFSPFAYSLDVLLPVVDLQQESSWGPLIPTPQSSMLEELFEWKLAHLLRCLIWSQIIFGWFSSLLLVATVSGFARRVE